MMIASAGLLAGSLAVAADANAYTFTWVNCPAGTVCLYTGTNYNGTVGLGSPFGAYGDNPLYGVYGNRSVINNSYSDPSTGHGVMSYTCQGRNGAGCSTPLYADNTMGYGAGNVFMDPINFIRAVVA